MKQSEILFNVLSNYQEYSELEPYFSANPSYIDDPIEYVLDRIDSNYKLNKELYTSPDKIKNDKALYNSLSEATLDLYSESLFTGFQTGFDFAMVLTGCRPIYNVLPESQQEQERIHNVIGNVKELVDSAGADKVAKLIKSLGYSSVAELIAETEK